MLHVDRIIKSVHAGLCLSWLTVQYVMKLVLRIMTVPTRSSVTPSWLAVALLSVLYGTTISGASADDKITSLDTDHLKMKLSGVSDDGVLVRDNSFIFFGQAEQRTGWKIHVSADNYQDEKILIPVLNALYTFEGNEGKPFITGRFTPRLPFKITDKNLGAKQENIHQRGKYITVYPKNENDYRAAVRVIRKTLSQIKSNQKLDFEPVRNDLQLFEGLPIYTRFGELRNPHPDREDKELEGWLDVPQGLENEYQPVKDDDLRRGIVTGAEAWAPPWKVHEGRRLLHQMRNEQKKERSLISRILGRDKTAQKFREKTTGVENSTFADEPKRIFSEERGNEVADDWRRERLRNNEFNWFEMGSNALDRRDLQRNNADRKDVRKTQRRVDLDTFNNAFEADQRRVEEKVIGDILQRGPARGVDRNTFNRVRAEHQRNVQR